MSRTARFQETFRRLAMVDEGFVEDQAGLGLGLGRAPALDSKAAALLRLGASVAIGSAAMCIEWSVGRALAAGATEDEIADVLLAIAPVTGLGRVVCAAPDVAIALGSDIVAALEELDEQLWLSSTCREGSYHEHNGKPVIRPGRGVAPVSMTSLGARRRTGRDG